jgi:hypothetical protein
MAEVSGLNLPKHKRMIARGRLRASGFGPTTKLTCAGVIRARQYSVSR